MESCCGTSRQALAPLPSVLLGTGTVTEHWNCSKHPMEHWHCSGTSHGALELLWGTPQGTGPALGHPMGHQHHSGGGRQPYSQRREAGQVSRDHRGHPALEPPKSQQGGHHQQVWTSLVTHNLPSPWSAAVSPWGSSPEVKVPGHGALWAPGTPLEGPQWL